MLNDYHNKQTLKGDFCESVGTSSCVVDGMSAAVAVWGMVT
jgi:hypothetical protein